ncbi:glutamate racemase [Candidatus Parcubacteria bacterium]|nr:MAG: glutamate racemase [Candidatus Parcubacteria bacterium]
MIGIFDSGFGGLTVLKEIVKTNPDYNYIYLGDNARVPYGGRSQELIYQYTREAVEFLFKKDCKLVILACNSASSMALRRLQQEWLPKHYPKRRVLGVVRPIAEDVSSFGCKRVGIIGTKATVVTNVYEKEIEKLEKVSPYQGEYPNDSEGEGFEKHKTQVYQIATPLLVPLIEESYNNKEVIRTIVSEYLEPLKEKGIERLVLACTHYPLLINEIREVMGDDCVVKNPAEIVAEKLKDYLERHKDLDVKKGKSIKYYTTDSIEKFKEFGEKILDIENMDIEKTIL